MAAGVGLMAAGYGLQAVMGLYSMIDANRRLNRLGARPKTTIPEEWKRQYADRLKRSKTYQGYTQSELANMQRSLARNQAGLITRGISQYGANPQAMLTSSSIYNANAFSGIGARSAELNRANQYRDYLGAEDIAMRIGGVNLESQRGEQARYDAYERQLGLQKQSAFQGFYNAAGTAGTLGYQQYMNKDE